MTELIEHYKNNLSTKGLVFKYIWFWWLAFTVACFLWAVPMLGAWFMLIFHRPRTGYVLLGIGVVLLLAAVILFVRINKKAKHVLVQEYGVEPDGFMWNGPNFFRFRRRKLRKFLNRRGFMQAEKLDLLIDTLEYYAAQRKYVGYWSKGIFAALVIPIWIQALELSLRFTNQIQYEALLLAVIVIIACAIAYICTSMRKLYHDFMNQEYSKVKHLIEELKEVRLNI